MSEAKEAINAILSNEKLFKHVVNEVYKTIDIDGSGTIEVEEIQEFITNICNETGIGDPPDIDAVTSVFKELDEDGSNTIEIEELEKFLRLLFEEQQRINMKAETK